MKLRRIGLVVNAAAGAGRSDTSATVSRLLTQLDPELVITSPDTLKTLSLNSSRSHRGIGRASDRDAGEHGVGLPLLRAIPLQGRGREATRELARALVQADTGGGSLDAVVVVGGDGTLSDVAGELAEGRSMLPVIGIGVGTMNVGSLVTCDEDRVEELCPECLQVAWRDALVAATADGERFAFNDIVIGTTLVGTSPSGDRVDIDASAALLGKRHETAPQPLSSPGALVLLEHRNARTALACGTQVGCVVVGLLDRRYIGKAVSGGACLAALSSLRAGVIVSEQPLVRACGGSKGSAGAAPVTSRFAGMLDDDTVVVEGIESPATVAVDGNAVLDAGLAKTVRIGLRVAAVAGTELIARPHA